MASFMWLVKMPFFVCPLFVKGASFCQDPGSFLHFMQLCTYKRREGTHLFGGRIKNKKTIILNLGQFDGKYFKTQQGLLGNMYNQIKNFKKGNMNQGFL